MGLTSFPLSPVKGGGTGWGAKEEESDKIFVVSVFWEQASRKTKPCALGCRFPLDVTRLQHCLGNRGSGTQLPFQVPQRTSLCKTTIHLTAGSRDGSERWNEGFLHMDNLDSLFLSLGWWLWDRVSGSTQRTHRLQGACNFATKLFAHINKTAATHWLFKGQGSH